MPENYEPMVTHCIGRNNIQMSGKFAASSISTGIFKPKGSDAQASSFEIRVENIDLTKQQFVTRILKRRAELNRFNSKTVKVLRLEKKLSDDATLFRVQEIDDAYASEIQFVRGNALVVVTMDSYDNTYLAAEASLIKFMSQFTMPDKTHQRVGMMDFVWGRYRFKGSLARRPAVFCGEIASEILSILPLIPTYLMTPGRFSSVYPALTPC